MPEAAGRGARRTALSTGLGYLLVLLALFAGLFLVPYLAFLAA